VHANAIPFIILIRPQRQGECERSGTRSKLVSPCCCCWRWWCVDLLLTIILRCKHFQ